MNEQVHGWCASVLAVAGSLLLGCSLVTKSSRPDPNAENVKCALEYQPAAGGDAGNDLLFLAWSSPYRAENFYMSLVDNLLHMAVAPGRHLKKDVRVEGAKCAGRSWGKGFRLPAIPSSKKWMLCRREALAPVLFEVETKWGVCSQRIPAGDTTPRDLGGIRRVRKLPQLGSPQDPPTRPMEGTLTAPTQPAAHKETGRRIRNLEVVT